MKSGMIVEIKGLGKVQVIGEKDLTEVWGLGLIDKHDTIMNPEPELLKKVLKECKRVTNINTLEKAKLLQGDLSERLDWIANASEKIKGENIDVTV